MITRIREVRRARGLTLDEVARRCEPPTTPQTIGRLETGTRTVSVGWVNPIARALGGEGGGPPPPAAPARGLEAGDLVRLPDREDVPVAALLEHDGAHAPRREAVAAPPRPEPGA